MCVQALNQQELGELARAAGCDPAKMAALYPITLRQLERIVRKQCGVTPEDLCRQIRADHAIALLSQGFTTKAAAKDAGYSSSSHLCHELAKLYGKPPKAFAPTFGKTKPMSLKSNDVAKGQSF